MPRKKRRWAKYTNVDWILTNKLLEQKKARMDYDKSIEGMERKIIKQIRTGQRQDLMGTGSHKKNPNVWEEAGSSLLKSLISKPNGILTIDENKIDEIARKAWNNVYDGNIQNEDEMIIFVKIPEKRMVLYRSSLSTRPRTELLRSWLWCHVSVDTTFSPIKKVMSTDVKAH